MHSKPTYEELETRVRQLEGAESERKRIENEQQMFLEVLQIINETETLDDLLGSILKRLKYWSGCEAAGIRLRDGPDFPYVVTSGFPDKFVEMEKHLCTYAENGDVERDANGNPLLECMCGNVLCERFDPDKNFFTSDGCFWTNCTTDLLKTTTDSERQVRTRNRCNSAGYESVALIPLRSAGETFGLIQLNDHRKGRFLPERIGTYRRIADSVAGFLAKRQARAKLRKSETHLRILLDTLPDLVWLKDPEGIYLNCNPRFESCFGAKRAEIIGKTDYDFVAQGLADFFREKDKAAMAAGRPSKNEEQLRFADDGHVEILETVKTPVYDPDGRLAGVLGIARDITHRKQAEEAQRYQAQLLREVGGIAKVGGWEFDPATGKGTWTEEVARIHEVDPASETSLQLGMSFYHGESRARIERAVRAAIAHGEPYDLELELVTAQGTHKWVRTIGQPRIDNGQVVQVRGSFQDITASKAAEQRIEHLNLVLKSIRDINQLIVRERDPAVLIREGCRLLVHNRGYASALIVQTGENEKPLIWAMAGIAASTQALDSMLKRGEHPPCWERLRSVMEVTLIDDRDAICGQCPLARQCVQTHSLYVRLIHEGVDYGYLVVVLDQNLGADDEELSIFYEMAGDLAYALHSIQSENKRQSLQKQLIESQKMESVGRLAGGVAHDYNNMLSVIIGYAELTLSGVPQGGEIHENLKEILASANRSVDITRQLLAFARRQTIAPEVLDLNEAVSGLLKMLRRLIGENIDLAWHPGAELWNVKIDPSQIDQILANLCVNARDAIADVGKVTIETKNVIFDAASSAHHHEVVPGEYVMLAVSDDGSGMERQTLDRIFEPFFTTKQGGRGTGLGLSTVFGIVKQNGGFINVYSEPNTGTTFRIYLTRHAGEAETISNEITEEAPSGHGELVLVVEDDVSILNLLRKVLERLNYEVLTANTPSEAVRLAREHGRKIYLLLTDLVMPGMNGKELSERLLAHSPHLKCLFMSGYPANVIARHGVLDEGVNFIQKPVSQKELAAKLRDVLEDSGQTNAETSIG